MTSSLDTIIAVKTKYFEYRTINTIMFVLIVLIVLML